jgi:hypothetical protein
MVPARGISYIGMLGAGFIAICIVMIIVMNQFNGFKIVLPISLLLLCILAILAPVKGFWETTIKDDNITASRLWVIQEHAKISEISYCQKAKGGIHIYVKNSDKKVMSIDSMCTNLSLFYERMEKEGIEILPYGG